jgi:hypothetical protein
MGLRSFKRKSKGMNKGNNRIEWSTLEIALMEELTKASQQHSCIMATAVFIRVLNLKGVDAYPVTVKVSVYNPYFSSKIKGLETPPSPELVNQWGTEGAACVKIGDGEETEAGWPNHLIAVVPNAENGKDLVFDFTITQVNRAEMNINIKPVVMLVSPGFFKKQQTKSFHNNECLMRYESFPEDRSYEQAPIWQDTAARDHIANLVLSRI